MMTGGHMVKVLAGIQMLYWNSVFLSYPQPSFGSVSFCLSYLSLLLPVFFQANLSLCTLQADDACALMMLSEEEVQE